MRNNGQAAIPVTLFLLLLALAGGMLLLAVSGALGTGLQRSVRDVFSGSWDLPAASQIELTAIRYSDLPLSEHALTEHADEEWNARTIAAYFDSGKCVPKQYICPEDDIEIVYCQVNPKKAIGLMIGLTVRRIVSGFMGNISYWENRCTH